MNNTAAPTPWYASGTSILDAESHLVCVLASRHLQRPEITGVLAAAPELRDALAALLRLIEINEPRLQGSDIYRAAVAALAKARGP